MLLRKSDSWITQQLSTIGSTAAGTLSGFSPYQTPAELYDLMRAVRAGHIPANAMNDDMRRGILTEPLHRQLLEDTIGRNVHEHDQDDFVINEKYPWAHALPDGWLTDVRGEESAEHVPVQLKCPRPAAWHKIKLDGIHGHWLLGSQHALAVTGASYEYFSVLNVETMRLIHMPVYRDDDMINHLMQIEEAFMTKLSLGIRPPDDPYQNKENLMEISAIGGEMIRIETDEARALAEAYASARELRNESVQLMEQAESQIKRLMGDARIVQLPRLRCYNRVDPGRVTYDYTAMTRDGIDVGKYIKQGKPFAVFQAFIINGEAHDNGSQAGK